MTATERPSGLRGASVPLLYALDADPAFGHALAGQLAVALAPHEDRSFQDGEHKVRPLSDPRGRDAYVVSSLYGGPEVSPNESPHDKLFRLLMFIATLHEHGVGRVTAVVPYLAYARKDRQTKPFDPVTLRYVAQLFEAVGTQQIMVLEVHNVAAFQNAFRCGSLHIEAHTAFDAVARELAARGPLAVASPDPGGVKRAQLWRESLQHSLQQPIGFAMADKRRSAGVVSSEDLLVGDVKGSTVLLLDDIIARGDTMRRAALVLRQAGARDVVAFAAHGLFNSPAVDVLADAAIDRVVVTDSVPAFRVPATSPLHGKLSVVSAVPLFAQAIQASHATWVR